MSYVKNNWNEGDVITAEKLNNIENGIFEINGLGELAVGGFQNGDILTLQTADNKTRKMKYTEVEVGIQYVEDNSSISSPEDMPDLVGTEEDLGNLQKLLDSEGPLIFKKVRSFSQEESLNTFSQIITYYYNSSVDSMITFVGDFVIDSAVLKILISPNNKGVITPADKGIPSFLNYSYFIVVKGFLPIE